MCRTRCRRLVWFTICEDAIRCYMPMIEQSPLLWKPVPSCERVTESPLRVTHVVVSLDTGGLERIVVDLVRFSSPGASGRR